MQKSIVLIQLPSLIKNIIKKSFVHSFVHTLLTNKYLILHFSSWEIRVGLPG